MLCLFSETLIQFCSTTENVKSLKIHGCISDGSYYDSGNIMDSSVEDNLLLGRKLGCVEFKVESGDTKKGMFWVKGKVGEHHLVSYGEGFNVWNAYVKQLSPFYFSCKHQAKH